MFQRATHCALIGDIAHTGIFSKFDSKGDGSLTVDDVGAGLKDMGVVLEPGLLKQAHHAWDANENGLIDFAEFVTGATRDKNLFGQSKLALNENFELQMSEELEEATSDSVDLKQLEESCASDHSSLTPPPAPTRQLSRIGSFLVKPNLQRSKSWIATNLNIISWQVGGHAVRLEHHKLTGRREIFVDEQLYKVYKRFFDIGSKDKVEVGAMKCFVIVKMKFMGGFTYKATLNGVDLPRSDIGDHSGDIGDRSGDRVQAVWKRST